MGDCVSTYITLRDVQKTYGTTVKTHALRSVSLELDGGEFVVILGPSGCGKTTLLNILGGLDSPTSGSVEVGGLDLSKLKARQLSKFRRDTVGFVFQFFNLVPSLTARENVEFAADLHAGSLSVDETLAAVGLMECADRFPSELSGGQQQRVAIARALAKRPAILLCDEPTGSVDQETGKQIISLLQSSTEGGCTLLVVTHNNALAQVADRVIHLKDGQIQSNTRNAAPLLIAELVW
jgi:putative ABC transport system ATP-binding protein